MTDLNFDFSQVNPIFEGGSFLPVSDAKGWLVILTKDDGWKQSQSKPNNWYLQLSGIAQEGAVAGQEFSLRLNLKNDNPKAVNAAAQELAALGTVLGLPGKIGNTAELFNRPFRVVSEQQMVDGKPTAYTQLATNGIRDVNGNMAGKAGAGPQQAAPAPQIPGQPGGGFPPQGGAAPPFQQGPQGGAPFAQQPPQGQAPFGTPAGAGGAPFQPQGQPQGGAPFAPQGQPFNPQGGAPFNPQGGTVPFTPGGAGGAPFGGQPGGQPAWGAQPGR